MTNLLLIFFVIMHIIRARVDALNGAAFRAEKTAVAITYGGNVLVFSKPDSFKKQ